jgi:hypothetical protein
MNDYHVVYRDYDGTIIDVFTEKDWIKLDYTRQENGVGFLYLDFPSRYPYGFWKKDGQLTVYRGPINYESQLDGETSWFIRLWRDKIDENGEATQHIVAYDSNHLIARRICAFYESMDEANKTDCADDMMKEIMYENFGLGSAGAWPYSTQRDESDEISIASDLSLAPSITKKFAWQKLIPLFQDICKTSYKMGTYLAFDLVNIDINKWEFRTYTECRGINRGSFGDKPLLLAYEDGLSYISYSLDATDERNHIYVATSGTGVDGYVEHFSINSAQEETPWNRIEDYYSVDGSDTPAQRNDDGNYWLQTHKPKIVINGHIEQKPGKLFGVDYGFGDIVSIQHANYGTFDVHIDTYRVEVDSSGENITIMARNYEDSEY